MIKKILSEMRLAKKTWQTIRSGFRTLQVRGFEEEWDNIEGDDFYDPYYVCAFFVNRRHIPLPLILGLPSEYRLQNLILTFARKFGFLTEAEKACRGYLKKYTGTTCDSLAVLKVEER